jgi:predicted nucleotidyltransferase
MNLQKIKEDLDFLKGREVVLYGSLVTGEFREGSDIDVAVITRVTDRKRNVELLRSLMGKARPVYDIKIFELLSLRLKASVMSSYLALWGEEPEISEYFYRYRKEWDDQKHRIAGGYFSSYKEKIAAMRANR